MGASNEESKDEIENTQQDGRSVVKAIKDKDPKQKDKYNTKYLILKEISDEQIQNDSLFKNSSLLNKCDAIIYLFESNDSEQVEFVKSACTKIKKCEEL